MSDFKITLLVKFRIGETVTLCGSSQIARVYGYTITEQLNIVYNVRWMEEGNLHEAWMNSTDLDSVETDNPTKRIE